MDIFPVLLQQESSKGSMGTASTDYDTYKSKAQKLGAKISAMMGNEKSGSQQQADSLRASSSSSQGPLTLEQSKLRTAAQEFESVFVAQLLSTMRQSSTETDFLGENSTTMKIFNGMLDEKYAMEIAKTGQLGLAEMLIQQLSGGQTLSDGSVGSQGLGALDGSEAAVAASNVNLPKLLSDLNIEALGETELDQLAEQIVARFAESASGGQRSLESNLQSGELPMADLLLEQEVVSVSAESEIAADGINQDDININGFNSVLDAQEFSSTNGADSGVQETQTPAALSFENGQDFEGQVSASAKSNDVKSVVGIFDTNEQKLIETERLPFGDISNVEDLASQLEVPVERVIILPPAENMPQSNFSNVLTGKSFEPGSESLNQLRQLQFSLQQQNSPNHRALNQRGLQSQNGSFQLPQFEVGQGYTETAQGTQNMVLSWSQIQRMDTVSLANVLSGTQGDATLPTQIVSSDQVIIQIADKLQPQLGRGFQQATIDLEPPSLGRLHIRLVFEDNVLSAQVQARNGMVSEIVRGNLAQLRNALSEHGIQIDNFQVMSNNSGQQDGWQNFSDWDQDFGYRRFQGAGTPTNDVSYESSGNSRNDEQVGDQYMNFSSTGIDHLV
ncbi:hypothetical protein CMK18_08910 [Candidatus Poribacteria bacterium]|nr:hypothetical protein [Candidatus Poribacteria bacterium]